jgi:formate-dependent nitrite reductase cytochrome c552 subunit
MSNRLYIYRHGIMARFPPSKWETHSVEELDRYLDEVLGPDAVTAKLQAAAFLAVRYDHIFND